VEESSSNQKERNVIYQRVIDAKVQHVHKYISPEHVYFECWYCKGKKSLVAAQGTEVALKTLSVVNKEFKRIHKYCSFGIQMRLL
jgi:hypothetical protein